MIFPKTVRIEGLKSLSGIYIPVKGCQRQVKKSFSRIKIILAEELLK